MGFNGRGVNSGYGTTLNCSSGQLYFDRFNGRSDSSTIIIKVCNWTLVVIRVFQFSSNQF